jgi:DNA-directed RNA polymerase subunit RPC12/RpoP
MLDWFNITLIALVLGIVSFIVLAVRKTINQIKKTGVSGEDTRKLAKRIRERDVRCPRCNRQSSAVLGTQNRYKCDSCWHEFEGPEHMLLS